MADLNLDALVYPIKTQPAPLIGGPRAPGRIASSGNILDSITGFPSLTVPAGYASDYEQATEHCRPPETAPSLRQRRSRPYRSKP